MGLINKKKTDGWYFTFTIIVISKAYGLVIQF